MTFEQVMSVIAVLITVLGGAFSFLAAVFGFLLRRNEKLKEAEFKLLKNQVIALETDMRDVRDFVNGLRPVAQAWEKRLDEMRGTLGSHVMKEEKEERNLADAVHTLVQRVTSMEARMPNGEILEIQKAVARIEAQIVSAMTDAARAIQHVEDHNTQAEDWKRRIVALETIIDRRRKRA